MKLSTRTIVQSLLFAAPIVFSSTIAIFPSRAASFAGAGATLTLENFDPQGNSLFTDTQTSTNAVSSPGSSAAALTPLEFNTAIATPERTDLSSLALAQGAGANYLATAQGSSQSAIQFDTGCGCLRFDFDASLIAIAQSDSPSEQARSKSFAAFYVFNNTDLSNPVDFFEFSWSANQTPELRNSSNVFLNAFNFDELLNTLSLDGYYAGQFAEGTQLTVRSVTGSEALVKAGSVSVPEPSAILALGVVPGLLWLKRRSDKKIIR